MKHLGQRGQVSVGWSRRTFLREGSGLAAAAVAAACGVPPGGGAGQAPASKTPVTITYMSPADPTRQQLERDMFDRFTAELPHLTVTSTTESDWNKLKEKFLVVAAAGTPADV